MNLTAPLTPETADSAMDQMALTVEYLSEWLIKQQQIIKQQQEKIKAQQKQIKELLEERDKLKNRNSKNSSVPPSSDQLKKPSDKKKRKKEKKRGPKYDHPGKTRNGFGQPEHRSHSGIRKLPCLWNRARSSRRSASESPTGS